MAEELTDIFEELAMELQDCRVIILTGTSEKAFCAGGDLKERHGMSDAEWGAQHLVYERMVRAVMGCPVPVIAAVNGAAYGGGCELAAMADFAYAADTARFAQTEVKLGIIPGAGGTQNLARAVGERRAKDLILSGRVSAQMRPADGVWCWKWPRRKSCRSWRWTALARLRAMGRLQYARPNRR